MTEEIGDVLKAAPAGLAARVLKVSTGTLTKWHRAGLISATATEGGHRRYDVTEYLGRAKAKAA